MSAKPYSQLADEEDALSKIYAQMTAEWRASKYYKMQELWVERTIFPLKLVLDSALFMGLRRFEIERMHLMRNDFKERLGSISRIVAFESWIDTLRKKFNIPSTNIYIYNNRFSPIERQFLTSLGHTLLEWHHVRDKITQRTFFMAHSVPTGDAAYCLELAMPDLTIASPLWVDNWTMLPVDERKSWARQQIRRYFKSHQRQRLGPCIEPDPERFFDPIDTAESLINVWLEYSECYWTPDNLREIGDIGQPIHLEEWRFLPGIFGANTIKEGLDWVWNRIQQLRKITAEEPQDLVLSDSDEEMGSRIDKDKVNMIATDMNGEDWTWVKLKAFAEEREKNAPEKIAGESVVEGEKDKEAGQATEMEERQGGSKQGGQRAKTNDGVEIATEEEEEQEEERGGGEGGARGGKKSQGKALKSAPATAARNPKKATLSSHVKKSSTYQDARRLRRTRKLRAYRVAGVAPSG